MDQRDVLLQLVQAVYAAPGSLEGWQAVLADVTRALHGSGAHFFAHDFASRAPQMLVTSTLDPEGLRAYDAHWSERDPWAHSPRTPGLSSGQTVSGEQLIPHGELVRTPFYNEFGRHWDVTRSLVGMIEVEEMRLSCVSINRGDRGAAFSTDEVALVQGLLPHLQRGLQLHRRLAEADVQLTARADALDRVSHGVLVLSAAGRLLFANRSGEAILRSRDGLAFDRHELRAARAEDTAALHHSLAGAVRASKGEGLDVGAVLTLGRPSGRRPFVVVISPVVTRTLFLATDPPAAVLFVTDPERAVLPDLDVIRHALDLTPGEARLTRLLAEGLDLDRAACLLGLTIETVRTRLKVIFIKTGTHRQAELVRLVLTSTAGPQL